MYCISELFFFHLTDADDDAESKVSALATIAPACDLQPPFQPSSTPAHLQHRFMVRFLNGYTYKLQIKGKSIVKGTIKNKCF
jgi:hypothetical protein